MDHHRRRKPEGVPEAEGSHEHETAEEERAEEDAVMGEEGADEDVGQISADIQRRLADQMEWTNVTGYPFYQAYRERVKDYRFYDQAYLFLERVWLEK